MKHYGSTVLSNLVGGGADVLPEVSPSNRLDGELAAIRVELVMEGVKCHRPCSGEQRLKDIKVLK